MNIRLNIRFNDLGVFSSAKFENVMWQISRSSLNVFI